MKPLRAARFVGFVTLAIALMGGLVMSLWNWLLPTLAGWHMITFPQALALLVLCRVLFGGWRGRGGPWRHRWKAQLDGMTPEERERFRSSLRQRWDCHRQAPRADAQS
jgi:hypothetical protein